MLNKAQNILLALIIATFAPGQGGSTLAGADPEVGETVRYRDFGAVGDGETDDFDAIIAAHEFANRHSLPVEAEDDAAYYIGGGRRTAVIQTDTDFGNAKFIIDDTVVSLEDRGAEVFLVTSKHENYELEGIDSLERGQLNIGVSIPTRSLLIATDPGIRRFIRHGGNPNRGAPQTDIFIVDRDGEVDPSTPIIWDFSDSIRITAYPIDEQTLKISGGQFTTIANSAPSEYTYFSRGFGIERSRVVLDGLKHYVTGEGDHGAPYRGFISISRCAYVTVKNTVLTARKTYQTIGRAGTTVSMGSYDINVNRSAKVIFSNVTQTNDINDRKYWGIMGSNYCKNLIYDGCTLSRFDAHQGVVNASVLNSTVRDITIIGEGLFSIKNSRVYGHSFISLRTDYGSTWRGDLAIVDTVWVPTRGRNNLSIISGYNAGVNDFGYTCYMPGRIKIRNLHIEDDEHGSGYTGPAIFSNFNRQMQDDSYEQKYPYVVTEKVLVENITTSSGKSFRLSDNEFMFRDVELIKHED